MERQKNGAESVFAPMYVDSPSRLRIATHPQRTDESLNSHDERSSLPSPLQTSPQCDRRALWAERDEIQDDNRSDSHVYCEDFSATGWPVKLRAPISWKRTLAGRDLPELIATLFHERVQATPAPS